MLSPPGTSTLLKLIPGLPSTLIRKGEEDPPSLAMLTRTPSLAGLWAGKRLVTVPTWVNTVSKRIESRENSSFALGESVNSWSLRHPHSATTNKASSKAGRKAFMARKDGAMPTSTPHSADHCPEPGAYGWEITFKGRV